MITCDANKYRELENFLNITAKSGWVDTRAVITEMAKLVGLDPDQVVFKSKRRQIDT